jgi:ribosomal RNA-processing protein 8
MTINQLEPTKTFIFSVFVLVQIVCTMANKRKHTETKPDSETTKKDDGPKEAAWSKSKKKRMRQLKAKGQQSNLDATEKKTKKTKDTNSKREAKETVEKLGKDMKVPTHKTSGSSLQESFKARLTGSRFRILNEELYTTTSKEAYDNFSSNPELYDQYHQGFRHQVEQWPVNPVSAIMNRLKSHIGDGKSGKVVVADFGCGDAELAKQLLKVQNKGKCPFKVHSFDLVASSDLVTACDMSNVPLQNDSVNVGIFCLSLMGTNLADFIREAHRVLRNDGRIHIAEVRSRFESKDGKGGFQDFVAILDQLGFECIKTDKSNKMFVLFELKKSGKAPKKDLEFTARPCIYKRR